MSSYPGTDLRPALNIDLRTSKGLVKNKSALNSALKNLYSGFLNDRIELSKLVQSYWKIDQNDEKGKDEAKGISEKITESVNKFIDNYIPYKGKLKDFYDNYQNKTLFDFGQIPYPKPLLSSKNSELVNEEYANKFIKLDYTDISVLNLNHPNKSDPVGFILKQNFVLYENDVINSLIRYLGGYDKLDIYFFNGENIKTRTPPGTPSASGPIPIELKEEEKGETDEPRLNMSEENEKKNTINHLMEKYLAGYIKKNEVIADIDAEMARLYQLTQSLTNSDDLVYLNSRMNYLGLNKKRIEKNDLDKRDVEESGIPLEDPKAKTERFNEIKNRFNRLLNNLQSYRNGAIRVKTILELIENELDEIPDFLNEYDKGSMEYEFISRRRSEFFKELRRIKYDDIPELAIPDIKTPESKVPESKAPTLPGGVLDADEEKGIVDNLNFLLESYLNGRREKSNVLEQLNDEIERLKRLDSDKNVKLPERAYIKDRLKYLEMNKYRVEKNILIDKDIEDSGMEPSELTETSVDPDERLFDDDPEEEKIDIPDFTITPIGDGVGLEGDEEKKLEEIEQNDWAKKLDDTNIKELYVKYHGEPAGNLTRQQMVEALIEYRNDILRMDIPNFKTIKLSDWTLDSLKKYLEILNSLPDEEQRFNLLYDNQDMVGYNETDPFKYGTSDALGDNDDTFDRAYSTEKVPINDRSLMNDKQREEKNYNWVEKNEGMIKNMKQIEPKLNEYKNKQINMSKKITNVFDDADPDLSQHEVFISSSLADEMDPAYVSYYPRDRMDIVSEIQIPAHWEIPIINGPTIEDMIELQYLQMTGKIGINNIESGQIPDYYNQF